MKLRNKKTGDIEAEIGNRNSVEELETLREQLKVLKGRKLRLEYDCEVVLEKVDPTAEEIMLALYIYGGKK